MSDLLKDITTARKIQSALKQASIAQIDTLIERCQKTRNDKVQQEEIDAQNRAKEQAELRDIKQLLVDKKIDFNKLSMLMQPAKPAARKRKSAPQKSSNKYTYSDNKTWNGEGKVPEELQRLLDEGYTLNDFLTANT